MILYNIKALEEKLANNEISDKEGFNYFLLFFILLLIPFGSITKVETPPLWINVMTYIFVIAINYWGLTKLFDTNNHIDGKDFYTRFFSLLLVNAIRTLLIIALYFFIIIIIMAILHFVWHIKPTDYPLATQIVGFINVVAIHLLFYYKQINSFNNLKTRIQNQ